MKSVTHSIFKTFLLSVLVVAQMHFAYAQTASILPPAKTTFLDANGKPLTAGTVESFIPATTTHKTTWQDAAETIPNANPLTLDAAGRALLLGSGSYRQVVKDRLNNVIWDQVTSSTGSGSTGPTATGDGDLVGTIKPWAGMTAPNQYAFTYGQELSRTTYSALFTAITSSQGVFCNSGSPILNGLGDTTNFWIGMSVELSCVAPGFTTIIAKTATTVTLALNSNVTTNTSAVFFPWGRGNGSTTFNMPDFRGFALAGNNNMGGVANSVLTTSFFGATNPNSIGAAGGNESKVLLLSNIASGITSVNATQSITVSAPATEQFVKAVGATTSGNYTAGASVTAAVNGNGFTSAANISANNSISVTSNNTGGIVSSASVAVGGAGYSAGPQTLTVVGGTCITQPQFTATTAAGVVTGIVIFNAGLCSVIPSNPVATTGGGGAGATLNIAYSAAPISLVQPTKTSNYIIKILPDDNSATASGVTALGGMTGSIACGAGLLCTGNTVSVIPVSITPPGTYVYATDFGVVCNGVTDTTTAAQAAITAAAGRTVVFPEGTCVISSTLLYHTVAVTSFTQGLQILGQGREKTLFDNRIANGYLIDTNVTTPFTFQSGVTLSNFKIMTTTSPANSGGIRINSGAYVKLDNLQITGITGNGVAIPATAGDSDSSFMIEIDRVRVDSVGKWCFDFYPTSGGFFGSNLNMTNSTCQSGGTVSAAVPPTSGGMRLDGQNATLTNVGFTTNNNVALYIAAPDTTVNVTIVGSEFENTASSVLPSVYVDGGLRGFTMTNSQCLNNDSFIAKGCVWFNTTSGVQGDVKLNNVEVRATALNNAYVAFQVTGTNALTTKIHTSDVYWQTFDLAGQTRFSGFVFEPIEGQAKFSISALNTALLTGVGFGFSMPVHLAGLTGSGEWVPFQIPSAGVTVSGIGGLTPATTYNFYLYNSAATNAPIVGAIEVSATAPTSAVPGGYFVKTGDSTRTYIGFAITDGAGNFQTTAIQGSQYPPSLATGGCVNFLSSPTSANFALCVTGETGTGAVVFDTAPTFSSTIQVTGNITSTGVLTTLGPAGTGANNAQLLLTGGSGANAGALVNFRRNNVALFSFGNSSGILGGASDDFVIYSNVSGAGVNSSFQVASATGAPTFPFGFGTSSPVTTTTNRTILATDASIICNNAGSTTLTLLAAATYPGRQLFIKTITAQTVISNASNVVPRAGGAASTPILAAAAGNWALLQSDGTNWVIMAGTP